MAPENGSIQTFERISSHPSPTVQSEPDFSPVHPPRSQHHPSFERTPPYQPQPLYQNGNTRPRFLPDPKSLSSISLRAFILGFTLALSLSLTIHCLLHPTPLWRAPFFLATLSLFHFLEYYITALYNPRLATVSAFLLSSNGRAYNAAHTAAFLECTLTALLAPAWQAALSNSLTIPVGLCLVALGQALRTTAMAHAGTNFNHTVQVHRSEGHVLVTRGVYAYLRHPSYFGFFWWGLGTQMVLGNAVCFAVYAVVLWMFFQGRIKKEEEFLVRFFGKEYEEYRRRTGVWIPFVR